MKKLGLWLRTNSLWAAALGLMIASSGLDGAWLAKMMMPGQGWMGYVLNTTSDVVGLILMFWFGVFRQSPKGTKRYKLALVLLPAEIVAVAYSWYFGYLQLLLVLPAVVGANAQQVALVSAGFIPLLLAFIGWAQALLAGKWDVVKDTPLTDSLEKAPAAPSKAPKAPEQFVCKQCGKPFRSKQARGAHMRFCKGESKQ
jgi:uncharacterized membrane protein YeaQ/YmgE (transglycosylase-associated protein family)